MIADTLYAKYINERQEASIVETTCGFATFKIINGECFIIDMFVDESQRKIGHGRELVGAVEELAKESGCINLTANIFLADKNASKTLISALICGFQVVRAEAGVLLIAKKVKEE